MRYASVTERLSGLGSDKWELHIRACNMEKLGTKVIKLTIGEPDIPTPPELIEKAHDSMRAGRTAYSNGRGEDGLLAALANKYTTRSGRKVTPENILCFPGTQTALFSTIMALVETGDEVLVGDPLYATYEGVIRSAGAEQVAVPLRAENGFRMTADDLEAVITPRSRVLLLNTPHNPTGAVLDAHEVAAIGEVCKKHDLWLVSDEVYESLIFDGEFASPFDNAGLAERTIVVSSISKSHAAPGFRSGWTIGPEEFSSRLLPLSETMLFGNQPFIADMTELALSKSYPETRMMREAYQRRANLVCSMLDPVPGIDCLPPKAGMFIMVNVSALGMDGYAFSRRLLEEKRVALMPGSAFGDQATGFVRLSLTEPDDTIAAACTRIAELVEKMGTQP